MEKIQSRQPLISVIVPVYNVETYLPACLDSLLAQTWQNLEIVAVNGSTSDACEKILEEYARRDGRLRVFSEKTNGVSLARNIGLNHAAGEYIAFVDADDLVHPCYLEWMYEAAVEKRVKLVQCNFCDLPEDVTIEQMPQPENPPVCRTFTREEFSFGSPSGRGNCWLGLYHRSIVEHLRFDEALHAGEDILFVTQAKLAAGSIAVMDSKLYGYRQAENSLYRSEYKPQQYTEVEAWEKINALVQNESEALRQSAEERLLVAYTHVYYRMLHSPYADAEKLKAIRKKAQQHKKAAWRIPNQRRREKAKALAFLYFPNLGAWLWKCGNTVKKYRKKK